MVCFIDIVLTVFFHIWVIFGGIIIFIVFVKFKAQFPALSRCLLKQLVSALVISQVKW